MTMPVNGSDMRGSTGASSVEPGEQHLADLHYDRGLECYERGDEASIAQAEEL